MNKKIEPVLEENSRDTTQPVLFVSAFEESQLQSLRKQREEFLRKHPELEPEPTSPPTIWQGFKQHVLGIK